MIPYFIPRSLRSLFSIGLSSFIYTLFNFECFYILLRLYVDVILTSLCYFRNNFRIVIQNTRACGVVYNISDKQSRKPYTYTLSKPLYMEDELARNYLQDTRYRPHYDN